MVEASRFRNSFFPQRQDDQFIWLDDVRCNGRSRQAAVLVVLDRVVIGMVGEGQGVQSECVYHGLLQEA